MIKVIIIDEHKSVLDAFSNMIDMQNDMEFVAGANNSAMAEILCAEQIPNILLSSIFLEKVDSGIELTKKIKSAFPEIKIITMSGFNEVYYSSEAKSAGADAFVSKACHFSEFLDTIRAVMSGEKIFPSQAYLSEIDKKGNFTCRELEVLGLLCHALKKKEISEKLGISAGTVKRHVENMLQKSNCKSTTELVIYAIKNGLVRLYKF